MKYYNFGFVERMKVEKTRGVKRTLEYVLGFLENERKERGRGRVVGSISKMNGEKKSGPLEGSGGRRLDKLMRHLDEFGLRRSKGQRGLHAAMVGTMLAKIFEGESDAGMKAAMAKHGIKSSNQQLMCITPRRFGKTTAVAMFCAALTCGVCARCDHFDFFYRTSRLVVVAAADQRFAAAATGCRKQNRILECGNYHAP